jgi:plastocyanin
MRPIVLCAGLLSLCACDESGSTRAPTSVAPPFPTAATVTVGAGGALAFTPRSVDVAAGGTVTWNWAADNTMLHNVTSGDMQERFTASPTQMAGSYQVPFSAPGAYFYFCTIHGRSVMNGVVLVH